jgi:hypothetical protein
MSSKKARIPPDSGLSVSAYPPNTIIFSKTKVTIGAVDLLQKTYTNENRYIRFSVFPPCIAFDAIGINKSVNEPFGK